MTLFGVCGSVVHFTEMCCGTEAGSYLRLIDSCITQLKAPGPSWSCNESTEQEGVRGVVGEQHEGLGIVVQQERH